MRLPYVCRHAEESLTGATPATAKAIATQPVAAARQFLVETHAKSRSAGSLRRGTFGS